MFEDVELKIKKHNQILFNKDSACLQTLKKRIELQKHRTIVIWALECAKVTLQQFEAKYPDEHRPRICLEMSEKWARGEIKMRMAQRAILDAHAVAKEIEDREYGALCHAIGQAGAVVHTSKHALGLPIYELTAIVLRYGKNDYQKYVTEKIDYYYERLLYWQDCTDGIELDWADFIKDH